MVLIVPCRRFPTLITSKAHEEQEKVGGKTFLVSQTPAVLMPLLVDEFTSHSGRC